MKFMTPGFMREWIQLIKKDGLKEFLRQKGWKIVAGIFVFYLIRDSILYILIPYLIINNIVQCQ
ncbi:MAG: hypothetical protein D8M58_06795 [Calditrichaeota bacterium]|nr:MAG: hypothetical protein DWQ03_19705 [Calditrichota bacterium]MBL1205086.1 hypothetical protein [Calditrichota bacterium]NOG44916.1 hypothetical protein [Calditrichota bacterium]